MTKQDVIRKLTSRKFWLAVIGFVTPLMIALGASESQITQVASIIMGGGVLIAYIVGEGLVDASHAVDPLEGLEIEVPEITITEEGDDNGLPKV